GPHPRSHSLGASLEPQALQPLAGTPPPLALARRLPRAAGASTARGDPTPARTRSAPSRLPRAAGPARASHPCPLPAVSSVAMGSACFIWNASLRITPRMNADIL